MLSSRNVFLLLVICAAAACSSSRVEEDESLAPFFSGRGLRGTFALLNNNSGDFSVYNLNRYRDSAYPPASTFGIPGALIGLQTGVIPSGRDMDSAFRARHTTYFQEVTRRIGQDTLQFWLDSISYGSKRIRGAVDTFWLNGSLTITPDEQLGLVKQLYFNQLPFHRINQEAVKNAMLVEDNPQYRLSYTTGTTGWDPQRRRQLGWVVGWIEENRHPYFFVINLESPDQKGNLEAAGPEILKGILGQLGFLKGAK